MNTISQNLKNAKEKLPQDVVLVAVSKTKPDEDIMEAYSAGQRVFGENKVQEMTDKAQRLPSDIDWHMIGHLQRNKVKYIAPFVSLIHAVDSLKLLKEINKEAKKNERNIACLLQVKIAEEESKFGMEIEEVTKLLNSNEFRAMKNISVKGFMGMATFTNNEQQIRNEFRFLKNQFGLFSQKFPSLKVLSMGMSGDYEIAIQEGSNMLRIGSAIFGERNAP
ncbi:MAG TPA: YggS family pyridoxal phosphate-dependent enzyme [Flavobacteriaceae bacterium]|nr:YggS family pyridoxal phosphate-dependent enzyme [Flavobacteriaceae bacterium]